MEIERDGMGSEIARRGGASDFYDKKPLQRIFGDSVRKVDWTVGSTDDVFDCNLHELETYVDKGLLDDKVFLERFDRYWKHLVTIYTYSELTDPDDKLAALSAIAQRLQKASGYTYLAELWFETLMTDLFWSASGAGIGRGKLMRQSKYRAPSWSWASVEGKISFSLYHDTELRTEPIANFKSGHCITHLLDTSKTGKVSDAQLLLSTKLLCWTTGVGKYFNNRHSLLLGDKNVGELDPDDGELDFQDSRLQKLYLCPLRRFGHRSTEADAPMKIEGLAVTPHAGGSNYYVRLGTFVLGSFQNGLETPLDNCPTQDIVLC